MVPSAGSVKSGVKQVGSMVVFVLQPDVLNYIEHDWTSRAEPLSDIARDGQLPLSFIQDFGSPAIRSVTNVRLKNFGKWVCPGEFGKLKSMSARDVGHPKTIMFIGIAVSVICLMIFASQIDSFMRAMPGN